MGGGWNTSTGRSGRRRNLITSPVGGVVSPWVAEGIKGGGALPGIAGGVKEGGGGVSGGGGGGGNFEDEASEDIRVGIGGGENLAASLPGGGGARGLAPVCSV